MFLDQFATYFTAEQRQSELYHLWSAIGVNMEKAILEEQNKLNAEMADINTFSEDTLRSWLAFFLVKVPYRISSTCHISITLLSEASQVTIPQYSQLKTKTGIIYTTLNETIISREGDTVDATCVQGSLITENGTYSKMIKIQATNPDLSYLRVFITEDGNQIEIPECSFTSSYDYLSYVTSWYPHTEPGQTYGGTPKLTDGVGVKGQWYNVGETGDAKFSDNGLPINFKQGDIVIYNGNTWEKLLNANGLNPLQYANNYTIPSNGFYAYYYDGYLYIKIFSGTTVTNPEGKEFTIQYISSDGIQGEIEENTLEFISTFQDDVTEDTVTLQVTNTKSTPATNQPSVGKLGLILKQRMYCNVSLSSIPEYTMWLKAQPEIGDCLVMSDWERYINSSSQIFTPTGMIDVYACDNSGNKLEASVINDLIERMTPYKDVGLVTFSDFEEVQHVLKYSYSSASSEDLFKQFIESQSSKFYSVAYLQSNNNSIFSDLDLGYVIQNILNECPYSSVGLVVEGYHYWTNPVGLSLRLESYAGEEVGGGKYVLYTGKPDSSGNEIIKRFVEVLALGSTDFADIYDEDDMTIKVGERYNNAITLDFSRYEYGDMHGGNGILECYWAMKDKGLLTIGIESGIRKLARVVIQNDL